MQSYLLEVRTQSSNQLLSQATAWFITVDVVVTAFHVVGRREVPGWLHEQPGLTIRYLLSVNGQRIQLDPLAFDNEADVALLKLSQERVQADILRLDSRLPSIHAQWNGTAFPGFHNGLPFALSGQVANVRPSVTHEALQLTLEQGAQLDWRGASGCPVCNDGAVVGMITSVTDLADTAWATTSASIFRLASMLRLSMPASLPSNPAIEAFNDFYLGPDDMPAPIGGRAEEVARLNQWISEHSAPKYLLLLGPAGRGKSALLTYWAKTLQQRSDWVTIFYPISIRFNTNLAASVYRTILNQLAALHQQSVSAAMYQIEVLRAKITDYLKMPLPDGRGLILILDGIDEAADWQVKADIFPPFLARENHLRIVLSARQRADDSAGSQTLRELGWDNPTVACTLPLQPLGIDGVTDIVKRGAPSQWSHEQIDRISSRLFSLSQGDPLVTRLWLDALRAEAQQGHPIDEGKLNQAPPGLDGWFSDWWRHQRELRPSSRAMTDSVVPTILGILSCAWGPLTLHDLSGLLRLLSIPISISGANLMAIIRDFDRLVIGDRNTQGYIFSHPQLGIYYCEQYLTAEEQEEYRSVLVRFCKKAAIDAQCQGQEYRIPQYVVRYFGAHLAQIQSSFLDYSTLLTVQWAEAWKSESGTYAGFLIDTGRAWQVLQIENHENLQAGNKTCDLASEILCALFVCTIGSLAANIPPRLVVALMHYQSWTPRQALEYVAQMPSNSAQCYALAQMIRLVPPNEQEYFLDITARLSGMSLGYVLQESADYLAEPMLRKALALTARERNLRGRGRAAGKIISRFSSSGERARLLGPIIDEILLFHDAWGQGQLFAFLYNCTPPDDPIRETLKRHAIAVAMSLHDLYARAYVFIELFDTIPQDDDHLPMLINSVFSIEKDEVSSWQYIELLTKTVSVLSQTDARWSSTLETLIDEIEKLPHSEQQVRSLVDVIVALKSSSELKRQIEDRLFAKLENCLNAIDSVSKLLYNNVDLDGRRRVLEMFQRLWPSCNDARTKIRLLVELANNSTDNDEKYFRESFDELMRVMQKSPRLAWESCLDMVCAIVPRSQLEKVLLLTEGIGDDQFLAKGIVQFDPTLSLGIQNILNHFNKGSDHYEQILAISEVIPYLPHGERQRVFSEMFQRAKDLTDDDRRGYALLRLVIMEPTHRTTENLLTVLDNIEGKSFSPGRWKCMAEFVSLSDILLRQNENIIERLMPLDLLQDKDRLFGIQLIEEWGENIVGAILRLRETEAMRVLTRFFKLIQDMSLKEFELLISAQILRLSRNGSLQENITRTIFEDLRSIDDLPIRAKVYAILAPVLREEHLPDTMGAIFANWHTIPHFGDHRQVLCELLERLTPEVRSSAIRLITCEAARQPDLDWEGLDATLAPYRDDADLDVVVDDVWDISEPVRYRILAKLLPKLNEELFEHVFKVSLHAEERSLPEAIELMMPQLLVRSNERILHDRFVAILNCLIKYKRAVILQVLPVLKPIIERLSTAEQVRLIAASMFNLACWRR